MSLTHIALCDMIEVKECESMRVLRSQSRDVVLTIAVFISGDPSDGRYSVASRRRAGAIRRQEAECTIALFVLFSRSIHRMRSIPHRHVHLLDRRDLAFVQPHQSLQRAAIRSPNVSICASSRSRCQLIVGPPKRLSQSGERKSHRLWQPGQKRLHRGDADVISFTTREQSNRCSTALLSAKGPRAISMHSRQVAASELMVAV